MAKEQDILKEMKKEWWEENMSHGAFALTRDEIDYYLSLFRFGPKKNKVEDNDHE